MNKAYSRINFQNAPSTATPLNATNLNKMDKAINDLDDRIIELAGYQEEAQEAAEMASSSASAAAKAAETATADAEARVNAIIEGLEVYTKEESDKKFAPVIKQVATGSPILITDSSDAGVIDFKAYGRSTQDGEPTPDSPQAIKSVGDGGYFDGELLNGYYNSSTGEYVFQASGRICSKNPIPCKSGDVVKIVLENNVSNMYICYYGENGYISMLYGTENANFIEKTIPNGATYFTFWAVNSGMTVDTVGHITVTINNKYALIVKSKGKNLLNINERDKNTGDFSYTEYTNEIVKGSAKAGAAGTFICSFSAYLENGKTYFFSQESTNLNSVYIYSDRLWGNSIGNVNVVTAPYYTHKADSGTYIIGYYSGVTSGTEYSIVKPMLRRAEVTDDTYEPYKETVTYIPLNEPLRSSLDGTVTDEVSLTEVTRRFAEVVFDGSDDEGWTFSQIVNNYGYFYIPTNGGKVYKEYEQPMILCDSFTVLKGISQYENPTQDCILSNNILSGISKLCVITQKATDLSTWKTWLQANPITVQYELAEPIVETIEPVDIVTYDNVTYLTASDDAEMEVTYATDTKSYIDSKFAELHAALVNML